MGERFLTNQEKAMRIFITLLITLFSTAALADGPQNQNGPRGGNATAIGVGVGIAGAKAVNQGDTNVNVNQETERQAPAFGLGGLASGDCLGVSGGLALSMPMGGGGIYGSTEDVECTKRETARVLYNIGMIAEARMVGRTLRPLQEIYEAQAAAAAKPKPAATSKPKSAPAKSSGGGSDDLGCDISPEVAAALGVQC